MAREGVGKGRSVGESQFILHFPGRDIAFFVVRKLFVRRASTMHNEQVSNSDGD